MVGYIGVSWGGAQKPIGTESGNQEQQPRDQDTGVANMGGLYREQKLGEGPTVFRVGDGLCQPGHPHNRYW